MSGIRWNEVIALFGGRFDPPHLGHREAVRGLFTHPGIREVWVLPSPSPPHKPAAAAIEDRLAMVELLFQPSMPGVGGLPVKVDRREVERARLHPLEPSYSFDTIQEIRRDVRSIAFVVGADQLQSLHQWQRFPEILGLCHWIILCRRPDGQEEALRTLRQWESSGLIEPWDQSNLWKIREGSCGLILAPTEAAEISSTEIRNAIGRSGEPPAHNLSFEVRQYLKQHRLYGSVAPNE